MRAGSLRHVVSIQEVTETDDAESSFTESWANKTGLGVVRASIRPLKAMEIEDHRKLELNVTHDIMIYYKPGITAKDRILFGSRIFDIESIINWEERNIRLNFLTLEII